MIFSLVHQSSPVIVPEMKSLQVRGALSMPTCTRRKKWLTQCQLKQGVTPTHLYQSHRNGLWQLITCGENLKTDFPVVSHKFLLQKMLDKTGFESIASKKNWQITKIGQLSIFWLHFLSSFSFCQTSMITAETVTAIQMYILNYSLLSLSKSLN